MARSVLVTGASGYVGRLLVAALAADRESIGTLVAVDVREVAVTDRLPDVVYRVGDVRAGELADLLVEFRVDCVVHLAAIVTPGPDSSREFEYSVDVLGTQNVIDCCIEAGVGQLIVTSSGAAYGYHADNPVPLTEDDLLRGNPEFAYADHKRQVEERLARARHEHPELRQLIFRPGAILGATVSNQITDLFEKPDEYVLVGGHMDCWDGATGAVDNASCGIEWQSNRTATPNRVRWARRTSCSAR